VSSGDNRGEEGAVQKTEKHSGSSYRTASKKEDKAPKVQGGRVEDREKNRDIVRWDAPLSRPVSREGLRKLITGERSGGQGD